MDSLGSYFTSRVLIPLIWDRVKGQTVSVFQCTSRHDLAFGRICRDSLLVRADWNDPLACLLTGICTERSILRRSWMDLQFTNPQGHTFGHLFTSSRQNPHLLDLEGANEKA